MLLPYFHNSYERLLEDTEADQNETFSNPRFRFQSKLLKSQARVSFFDPGRQEIKRSVDVCKCFGSCWSGSARSARQSPSFIRNAICGALHQGSQRNLQENSPEGQQEGFSSTAHWWSYSCYPAYSLATTRLSWVLVKCWHTLVLVGSIRDPSLLTLLHLSLFNALQVSCSAKAIP